MIAPLRLKNIAERREWVNRYSLRLQTGAVIEKTAFKEIYMKKRSDKNSATAAVTEFAGIIDGAILPPAGVELRSGKEHLIWSQFTRARAKSDWRDMDLIL